MVSSRSSQDKYIKDGNRLKQRVGVYYYVVGQTKRIDVLLGTIVK